MEADARTLLTFVAPLAIVYMTYSSITGTAAPDQTGDLKAIAVGQIGGAPKLPSAGGSIRNPFVPRSGAGGGDPAADATAAANPEKADQPLHLDGTVIAGKIRFAIINGKRITEGDYFRGMRLTKIDTTQVTLTGESEQVVLPLEIARSDGIHAPAAATIVSGSHAPSRPTASSAPAKPASTASKRTATAREPSKSTGSESGSLLGGAAAKAKPTASKTTKGGTSRR